MTKEREKLLLCFVCAFVFVADEGRAQKIEEIWDFSSWHSLRGFRDVLSIPIAWDRALKGRNFSNISNHTKSIAL